MMKQNAFSVIDVVSEIQRILRLVTLVCILFCGCCIQCVGQQEEPNFKYVDGLLTQMAPNHCGLYSLFAIANALGVESDLEQLIDGDFVSSDYGSSSLDLGRAAQVLGLHSASVAGWNVAALRSSGQPALLNLGISRNSSCGHWVAWLGDNNGQARIYDPLSELETVPYGVLLARWKGDAVIVSKEPIGVTERFIATIAWLSWMLVPLCVVAVARNLRRPIFVENRPAIQQMFSGAFVICLITLSWLGLDCLTNELNTLRNPDSTRVTNCQTAVHSLNIPRAGDNLIQTIAEDENSILVDARPAAYFRQGTIPGAVNIPVNSSLFDFVQSVMKLNRDSPIVVFCERTSCQWDQIVASQLLCAGFSNVCVYEPGIEGYYRQTKENPDE